MEPLADEAEVLLPAYANPPHLGEFRKTTRASVVAVRSKNGGAVLNQAGASIDGDCQAALVIR